MPEPGTDHSDLADLTNDELTAVRGELLRADGKSAALLALAGTGMALAPDMGPLGDPASWPLLACLVCTTVAMVLLLLIICPSFQGGGFIRHATSPDALDGAVPQEWRRRELTALSRIALWKFRLLRPATHLLIFALLLSLVLRLAAAV